MGTVVWVAGLITLIFSGASFIAGAMITHSQLRDVNRRRHEEGYNAGERQGWYDAADELWQRVLKMREIHAATNTRTEYHNGYRSGYEDASRHLNKFWDHLDRQ